MRKTDIDIGDLGLTRAQDQAVRAVLVEREDKRRRQCQARMRLAAYCNSERRLLGDGEVKMQVDPYSYHYWGQKLGYDCWRDAEFVAEYLRDNPEARIRSKADNLTIIAPNRVGVADLATNKRFSKKYAEQKAENREQKFFTEGNEGNEGEKRQGTGAVHDLAVPL